MDIQDKDQVYEKHIETKENQAAKPNAVNDNIDHATNILDAYIDIYVDANDDLEPVYLPIENDNALVHHNLGMVEAISYQVHVGA